MVAGSTFVSSIVLAETNLETMVVSATRQETSLMEVTSSISIVDSKDLNTINAEHISQVFSRGAGTWISRGNGQEHLTAIRSPVFTGAGACGAFLMAEDGIALRASGFCNVNQLFDTHYEAAESIEVFRGPNSALYGSNALFGGVNVLLPNPGGEDFAQFNIKIAQFDYKQVGLQQAITGKKHSVFYALTDTNDSGYRDESGFDQQKFSVKHGWKNNNLTVTNSLSYHDLKQETAGYIVGTDVYKDKDLIRSNENPEAYRNANSIRAYSKWNWAFSSSELTLTPYYRKNEMKFLMHFVPWKPLEKNEHESFGSQMLWRSSLSNSLDGFVGLDVELTKGALSEVQESPSPFGQDRFPVGVHYDYEVDAQTAAAYAGINWQASERISFEFVTRIDSNTYDYTNLAGDGSVCAEGVSGCRFYRPASREDSFSFNSNKLGVRFGLNDSHALYTTFSQSFRAPQTSELYRLQAGQQVANLEEVELSNIELGIRGQSAHMTYQLAVFSMEKTNGIFQDSNRQYVSGSDSTHTGVEYDLTWSLHEALDLRLAGTYANHKYSNNPNLLGTSVLLDGNFIDTAPQTMNTFLIHWQPLDILDIELEWLNMGDYFTNPENTLSYEGHDLVNLRGGVTVAQGLRFQLNITNLMDERYAERADVSFGDDRYFPGMERRASLSLTWRL